jgi:hypothetical protein
MSGTILLCSKHRLPAPRIRHGCRRLMDLHRPRTRVWSHVPAVWIRFPSAHPARNAAPSVCHQPAPTATWWSRLAAVSLLGASGRHGDHQHRQQDQRVMMKRARGMTTTTTTTFGARLLRRLLVAVTSGWGDSSTSALCRR